MFKATVQPWAGQLAKGWNSSQEFSLNPPVRIYLYLQDMYECVRGSATGNVVQKSSDDYTDLLAKPSVSSVMAYICVFTVAATVINQQWTSKI